MGRSIGSLLVTLWSTNPGLCVRPPRSLIKWRNKRLEELTNKEGILLRLFRYPFFWSLPQWLLFPCLSVRYLLLFGLPVHTAVRFLPSQGHLSRGGVTRKGVESCLVTNYISNNIRYTKTFVYRFGHRRVFVGGTTTGLPSDSPPCPGEVHLVCLYWHHTSLTRSSNSGRVKSKIVGSS